MKTCNKCDIEKALEDFYKHPSTKDGRDGKCKECAKRLSTRNRNQNIEAVRAYDRKRGNRQSKAYLKDWREKYPNKYKAHNAVNNALRDGRIDKGCCEVCGFVTSVAHHDDYSKPLEVRWLCQGHHKQWHAENGEGLNG